MVIMSGTKKEKFVELDIARGIAAFAVFAFHSLWEAFGYVELPWKGMFRDLDKSGSFLLLYPFSYGWAGVAVFFALSGFCIHLSVGGSSATFQYAPFFRRRFFRIYPPYALALMLFTYWAFDTRVQWSERVWQFTTHALAVHNLFPSTFFGINGSFWSIAVEIQLYLIYPLIMAAAARVGWTRIVVVFGGIEVGIRLLHAFLEAKRGVGLPHYLLFSPLGFAFSWTIGAWVAEQYLGQAKVVISSFLVAFLGVACVVVPQYRLTAPLGFPMFAAFTAALLCKVISGEWRFPGRSRVLRHLAFLGTVSYSFYLLHQPLLAIVAKQLPSVQAGNIHPFWVFSACLVSYPLLLAIGYLYYLSVELPSMALGRSTKPAVVTSAVQ